MVLLLSAIKYLKSEVSSFLPLAPTVNYSFSSEKQIRGSNTLFFLTLREKKENVNTRRWAGGVQTHVDSMNAVLSNKPS